MPGVFPLNDFSQPNAHGRLPRDLLTASFTPPSLSPHHLFHLRLYATPQTWPPPPPDVAPPSCTRPRSSYFPVHVPWAVRPWQQHAGKGAAPPFLGTKKQLIYVSETGCRERPSYCVCGSLSAELTRRARVHCCPVITVMCRIHVELKLLCSLFFF